MAKVSGRCPNCNHENESNARYCSSCGILLEDEAKEKTIVFPATQVGGLATDRLDENLLLAEEAIEGTFLALRFVKDGQIMPLPGSGDYILGRVSSGQTVLPDIDLSPYDAYEAGVSRLHVLLSISEKSISITDLGSSNGTFVNKQKLQHHVEVKLKDKDHIQLGRLNMQAIAQTKK